MKILFLGLGGYNLPYSRVRCYHFAEILQKLGYETEVFSIQDDLVPHFRKEKLLEPGDLVRLWLIGKAVKRISKKPPDLIYLQKAHWQAAISVIFKKWKGIPYILDYDDYESDRAPFFNHSILNKIIFRASGKEEIISKLAQESLGCIAASHALQDFLSKYHEHVFLIPTGVDTKRFQPNKEFSTNHVGKAGKITFTWSGDIWGDLIFNNVVFLLDCFSLVASQISNVRLKLALMGSYQNRLENLIKMVYLDLDVEIHHNVAPDAMPKFLSDCQISLLPLLTDSANKEKAWMEAKSPTKLFEYMAMGIPTIASDIGEVKYIIKNGQDGFLAANKEDFVKKMIVLANDNELRNKLGQAAYKKVLENFSLQSLGLNLKIALEKLMPY